MGKRDSTAILAGRALSLSLSLSYFVLQDAGMATDRHTPWGRGYVRSRSLIVFSPDLQVSIVYSRIPSWAISTMPTTTGPTRSRLANQG